MAPAARPPRTPRKGRPEKWPETVNRFMDWLDRRERSKFTTRNYRDDLMDFALWWENEGHPGEHPTPVEIAEEDLRDWKRHLRTEPIGKEGRTRKPGSVNVKLAALK